MIWTRRGEVWDRSIGPVYMTIVKVTGTDYYKWWVDIYKGKCRGGIEYGKSKSLSYSKKACKRTLREFIEALRIAGVV